MSHQSFLSFQVFTGNSNADSVVHHKLLHSLKARFLRFIPLKWNVGGHIGLRVEVFGCSYKSDIADFDGRSSLLYRFNQKLMSTFKDVVSLKFKSMQEDGVLFHGEGQRGDYITLELQKGKLSLHINLGDSNLHFTNSHTSVTLGSLLDDQHWHSVLIERFNKQVNFTVDKHTQHFRTKGDSDHLDIDYELSFGGIPVPGKPGTFQRKNFHGCIENLYYNGVNIIDLAKRRKPQIYTVVRDNVCFLSSLLLLEIAFHFPTWRYSCQFILIYISGRAGILLYLEPLLSPFIFVFFFFFPGTNLHDGLWHSLNINARRHRITLTLDNNAATASYATTVSRIYSGNSYYFGGRLFQMDTWQVFMVQRYKHNEKSGSLFYIMIVWNVLQDKIWTAVQHNNTGLTRVQGAGPEKPYTMSFNYNSSAEQLEAVISSAEYCEQEAAYHCKKSRLLNTPSKPGHLQLYWGKMPGTFTESRETNDTGLLAFKDHLPVTQIVITDTNRSNSEAAWKIGPLRCYGDRQFWNAASFNTEASYLHFPTFHAEVSADISFFFKTTSLSGVFLENLGMKDFIRVEIRSPKEITFSIDVGNGPTEATVQSPTPLNDNQWHYVRAERNLKQTSLQVDNLPKKVLEAPAEGHFRLQLNSQLFVGGTASRQKGFLGCIRSLHLNGQKLDLEERAKMTPGVKPGCPGHCSSYGNLCHNGGKCVEKYNGYSCDCTSSAYEGPFCKEEVSALFEAGTSITYIFQEPYPVTKNASTSSSAIYADAIMSKENIAFSFLTAHAPSLLLYINTYFHEYLAVILSKNGSLQVRYKLSKDGLLIFTIDSGNFANREMHHVKINREGRELLIQVDQVIKLKHNFSEIDFKAIKSLTLGKVTDSLSLDPEVSKANAYGFTGCMSSVWYNHIVPLKAALRHPSIAPVTVKGSLTESSCSSLMETDVNTATTIYSSSDGEKGKTDEREPLTNAVRSDSAVIGGVIAVVIFIIFCIIAIMSRFLYQHKQAHRSSQTKEKEYPENLESSFKADIDLQNTVSECKREYFI
uniref:Contactin associated protein like 5 n=1 Tax=Pavo cristatus TaxID=9049 RepID=A0A8C9FZD2_PAVCR